MASEKEISALIKTLRNSTSQRDQLMTLVKGWRTIRSLTPAQRRFVATHVGLDEAEALLQRLGRPAGIAPARLLRAIRQAEKARPRELGEILQGLRDPSTRAEAARRGLDVVSDVVEEVAREPAEAAVEETPAGPQPPPAPPSDVPPIRRVGDLKIPEPRATKRDVPEKPRPASSEPSSPASRTPPSTLEAPEGQPSVRESKGKAAPAQKKPPGPVSPRPLPPPMQAESAGWERLQAASSTRPAGKPEPARLPIEGLAAEVANQSFLTRRFGRLREALESDESLGDTLRLLQAFPVGWARRRALQALIRSGRLPAKQLSEAFATLENPRDEYWCVSTLLRSELWDSSGLEELASQLRNQRSRRLVERHLKADA